MPVKPVANKKISLKKNNEENEAKKRPFEDNNVTEDGISLNVDDTLDMFEEESQGNNKNRKQSKGKLISRKNNFTFHTVENSRFSIAQILREINYEDYRS